MLWSTSTVSTVRSALLGITGRNPENIRIKRGKHTQCQRVPVTTWIICITNNNPTACDNRAWTFRYQRLSTSIARPPQVFHVLSKESLAKGLAMCYTDSLANGYCAPAISSGILYTHMFVDSGYIYGRYVKFRIPPYDTPAHQRTTQLHTVQMDSIYQHTSTCRAALQTATRVGQY